MFFMKLQEKLNQKISKKKAIQMNNTLDDEDDDLINAVSGEPDDQDLDPEKLVVMLNGMDSANQISAEEIAGDNLTYNEGYENEFEGIEHGIEEQLTPNELSESIALNLATATKLYEDYYGKDGSDKDSLEYMTEFGVHLAEGKNDELRLEEDSTDCTADGGSEDPDDDVEDIVDDDDDLLEFYANMI